MQIDTVLKSAKTALPDWATTCATCRVGCCVEASVLRATELDNDKFGTEQRRAFGFWTFVLAVAGTPIFGRAVLYVTLLSVVALIPNFSSETPVEVEGAEDGNE
jgi:hypothetical protein